MENKHHSVVDDNASQTPQQNSQQNPNEHHLSDVQTDLKKRKSISKIIILPAVLILTIIIAISVFLLQPGNITRQEALDLAIAEVGGGRANWPEMDFEDFRRTWSVEVFFDGLIFEVYVSRFTGETVRVEVDR